MGNWLRENRKPSESSRNYSVFSQKIVPSPAEFQEAAEIVGIRVGKPPENGWTTL